MSAAPAVRNGLVAAAYAMLGWAGLLLAVPPGYATGIGLPAGISLAAILRWGPGMWPGVWLGAFLLNAIRPGAGGWALPEPAQFAIAAALALGATLQPLAIGRLLVRSEPAPLGFDTLGSVLRFALIWSPAGCLIAASAGVGTLWIAGILGVATAPTTWLIWWFGDWMGVVIVAPALLALLGPRSLVAGISDTVAATARANLLATAFDQGGEAIFIADADLGIVEVNPAFCALTGMERDQAIGTDVSDLFSGRTSREQFRSMAATACERGHWQGEVWGRTGEDGDSPHWLVLAAVRNDSGLLVNHVGSFVDISERKHAEAKIEFLAHHDALTGLPNRFALQGRLEQALAQAARSKGRIAVMFIDMDRFKDINDSLGHDVGDLLLLEIAGRLRKCVRTSDVVARLGGDEFVVVLAGVADAEAAASTAAKLRHELATPYPIRGRMLHSSPSIGISMYPEHGETADVLTRNADAAMYRAKDSGRNNYQFFDVSLSERARERLELAADLRVALEQCSFLLHFQPQVRASDGRIVAAEALIRWPHPTRGMVPPDKFIGIAEEFGLIDPIGEWVLAQACRELAALNALGLRDFRVCVNLSPKQLRDRELPAKVAAAIAGAGIRAADLELELTESVAMQDPQSTILLLNQLYASGVGLAVDDFGTGYSSLSYLKMLPLHNLKLDRTFVRDIEVDPSDRAICSATVALAHALGIKVVAEGVETEAQRDFLLALGCDYLQGWLFSKPVPADQLAALVHAAEDRA